MGNKQWGLTVAAVALALLFGQFGRWQYRKAVEFETRAKAAEAHNRLAQVEIDLYKDQAAQLTVAAAKKDTVVRVLVREVAAVDSATPPDTSCAPNLRARDHVIEAQASEITDLHGVTASQVGAINLLQASKDELAKALASRPSYFPRFVGPNIGVGVFAGACGVSASGKATLCVGVGVTMNLLSLRL